MLTATYVLPYRSDDPHLDDDLIRYLDRLRHEVAQVVVVDGSDPRCLAAHAAALPPGVEVVAPEVRTPMGKVGGVLTGVRRARHDRVVVADDDVRYDADQLARVVALLDRAEVVRPANAFDPRPWHALLDTGRSLLHRMAGGDWPGTLGVRRSALLAAGGYRGDVLFENLELVRTIEDAGGRSLLAQDVIVPRRPPTTAHYRGQRVRQAYDELARPGHLACQLAIAPLLVVAVARRRWRGLAAAAASVVALAEAGRRRDGGRSSFPPAASVLAPLWVLERAVCSWVALGARLRGGVRYRDGRLRVAASSPATRRARRAARPAAGRRPPFEIIPLDRQVGDRVPGPSPRLAELGGADGDPAPVQAEAEGGRGVDDHEVPAGS